MWLLLVIAVALLWLIGRMQGNGASQQQSGLTEADMSKPLELFTQAWGRAEGYDVPGSLAQRNNNPGNLKGDYYHGVIGVDSHGFAIFDSPDSGFAAAQSYVQRNAANNPGWTIQNFFAKVLGNLSGQPVNNEQGNSNQEADTVASILGVPSDSNLSDYIGG